MEAFIWEHDFKQMQRCLCNCFSFHSQTETGTQTVTKLESGTSFIFKPTEEKEREDQRDAERPEEDDTTTHTHTHLVHCSTIGFKPTTFYILTRGDLLNATQEATGGHVSWKKQGQITSGRGGETG